ncbi:enoyl-CoA hydratase [Dietzia alimentaria]|jgi:crotonobetainyl-CoA hydratase|uniref:Probable enoyl-CoA hydratase EchA17 n=1 Tax=Dietzia maris TaxID=37915 RepID=A0A365PB89_9ACTN|nr:MULTISPECIES: crotonase/enoyl-CoA hydratase family protein [Dietzia]ODQ95178.1 enoyl-CoA hydratase [Dietzia alimentaria]HBD22328.1 enoyl-CoA hydratase [Dietzia sp.]MBB0997854.1 crotonase/enoyl-CoA hydratase family protein [Dietzia maris]MCZ4540245.1 crotonase/enoyl-CoA hydratase family protein [Dietzia maris]MCZ4657384.1 crotonase/enoyl-CoA hydratase family protein [Dietzia kunjamensis]
MTSTENRPAVRTERRDHVLLVTLDRPEARNAVNGEVSTLLGNALHEADTDPEIRVVVITGAGERSFCAGADLKAISRGEDIFPAENRQWGFAGMMQQYVSVPVIGAVNGTALGGGCEIALACDLVVAADHAVFGLPEVRRGLIAAAGGAFRLPAQLPHRVAMEMMLTGEPITAGRALDLHLINHVVPADRLLDTALELAGTIAANAPLAVQGTKRVALGITDGGRPAEVDQWKVNDTEMITVMTSEDAAEGPRAFAEKRAPVWKAR